MTRGVAAALLVLLCAAILYALGRLQLDARVETGSRYVSWLPSFSVEVTRVRAEPPPPPHAAQLDAMVRQVQSMFPQYPARVLAPRLAASRSAALTIDDILEGRLPAPPPTPPSETQHVAGAPPSPPATPAPEPEHAQLREEFSGAAFPCSASAREAMLRRRKRQLIESARQRYLASRSHAHAHTDTHAHTPAHTHAHTPAHAPAHTHAHTQRSS